MEMARRTHRGAGLDGCACTDRWCKEDVWCEDVDTREAANILTSFLRCPMVDFDPDEERDAEEEEEEQGDGAEDSEDE